MGGLHMLNLAVSRSLDENFGNVVRAEQNISEQSNAPQVYELNRGRARALVNAALSEAKVTEVKVHRVDKAVPQTMHMDTLHTVASAVASENYVPMDMHFPTSKLKFGSSEAVPQVMSDRQDSVMLSTQEAPHAQEPIIERETSDNHSEGPKQPPTFA